ncbi:MAG: isoprenylcysteine carboxylmethyltransferase family protein [Halobacteriales archaeon]|nr:isoprenylcysteine carboxylmethyltransferase family protein [Halobacteriales archaeon]
MGPDTKKDETSGVELRAYPFALAPMLVVLAVTPALAFLFPSPVGFDFGVFRYLGVPVVVAGLALALWAVDSFARAGETPSPAERSERLVTEGALSHTRNPIYVGTVVAGAGAGVFFESVVVLAYAVLLWVVYHILTVYKEEPELRDELGEEYDEYCERVPRWV